ncbi:MAG: acetyl-CoA hydrolase/transferase C-terminal domain-containing protein [Pseudomonadota bacterium]
MTEIVSDVEACVDSALARLGKRLVIATPLGLGKPVQLLNAIYRRAKADQDIELHIFTALSLEVPTPDSHIEAGLAKPIMERLFGDYEGLDYMADLRANTVPDNIQVSELYFKAGAMKGVESAQRNYISSNYTHIARDMCAQGVNLLLQLVAARKVPGGLELSLASNPDTATDVIASLRAAGREFMTIAQTHPDMPFMGNDALVPDNTFDLVLNNAAYDRRLFAVPNGAVPLADYATAIHASSLVPDGGTLQIGIGALGDAVAQALILRHTEPVAYQNMLDGLTTQPPALQESATPFSDGLYCSTEMFVNGMLQLIDQGIIKRRVYDEPELQAALNEGLITERVDEALMQWGRGSGFIPRRLDAVSLARLQHWGILPANCRLQDDTVSIAGQAYANDLDDSELRSVLVASGAQRTLSNGRILHGGFFLGPSDFYRRLAHLDDELQDAICMTSVLRTNQLLQNPRLYSAQRRKARFINTGMLVTLTGAVSSDALEDGTVISGVGGQYNFVAMAHDLPEAHSVLCIRSTRGLGKQLSSNVVPHYGHITIPKHLRDVIVTEYGVAELRGQSDSEIIKRLLCITDSRFQAELLAHAKTSGKVEADYEIPPHARDNTPTRLGAALKAHYRSGLLRDYPFGTELTADEIALAASLRKIRALSEDPPRFMSRVFRALLQQHDEELVAPFLERVDLRHPGTTRDFLVQQLLMMELEERGLLKAG